MLRSVSSFALTAAALCAVVASARAQTAPFAYAPPPALTSPIDEQGAAVPVIFQWTAVSSPGYPYGVIVQGRGRMTAPLAASTAINYELQIAEDPGGTRVLFDVITAAPRYVFFNQNLPNSGFTSLQPPGLALTAGRYWWRVRAISAGPAAPFSQPQAFALRTNATGSQIRDLAVDDVRLSSERPSVQNGTMIFARVLNAGTFVTQPTAVHVSVNGTPLADGMVQFLNPNESVSIAVPWTPSSNGYANVQVRLDTVDDKPSDDSRTLQTFVYKAQAVRTGMTGTIDRRGGDFVLLDRKGRAIASVTSAAGSNIDLESFKGKLVTVTGRIFASPGGFTLQADRVGAAQP